MTAFNANPNAIVQMILPNQPTLLFGSKRGGPNTRMQVTNVSLTSNVVTLNVTMLEGNIPSVGDLIFVTGTQNTSGLFNVSSVALTGVTINAVTGLGTITFALTHANVASAADAGQVVVLAALVGETITAGEFSQSVALVADAGQDITWEAIFTGTAFSTIQMDLQGSEDAAFTNPGQLDTFNIVGSTIRHVTNKQVPFLRVAVPTLTGGDGTSKCVVRVYVKYRGASS